MLLDLTVIAEQLRADGIEADVAQTGGGVATLLVGNETDDGRAEIAVGPGSFATATDGTVRGIADTEELYIGPDDDSNAGSYAEADNDEDAVAAKVATALAEVRDAGAPQGPTAATLTSLPPEQLQAEQARVEGRYVGRRFRRVTDRTEGTATAAKANVYGGNPTLTIAWDDGTASQRSLSAVVSL